MATILQASQTKIIIASRDVFDISGIKWSAEVESIEDKLFFRLNAIERAALLCAGALPPSDADRLDLLCDSLRAVRQ